MMNRQTVHLLQSYLKQYEEVLGEIEKVAGNHVDTTVSGRYLMAEMDPEDRDAIYSHVTNHLRKKQKTLWEEIENIWCANT